MIRPFERRKRELATCIQRFVLSLLPLLIMAATLDSGAALAVESVTLRIPSKTVTLPNGLTVVVSNKHKLPMVSISVRLKVGSAYDPEDKAGLATLTARLLGKGTIRRTATVIADELDFLGAHLEASAGGTGSTVSLSLLAKDVERGLDLLADLLPHSRFDTVELAREQAQMLAEIHQQGVEPGLVVAKIFRETLYAGHPLHRPISGYAHTVSQITREDVIAFHQRFYVPNNAIVVVVGALSEERLLEVTERYLGAWPARPLEPIALPQPTPTTGKQVRIGDMEVNQSFVQWGHLSVRRADPEFASIQAMNYLLGGGEFMSRLTRSIREQQGLAYDVASQFVGGSLFPGFFSAELQTSIATTAQALKSLMAVIQSMQKIPVTSEELSDMKRFYEGSLPARAETYEQVAELLIDREFYGLPDGYWEAEIRRIQQLTDQDMLRLAQRYLDTDNFVLALVSERAQLDLADAPIPTEAIRDVPVP
jgi:zinc protease